VIERRSRSSVNRTWSLFGSATSARGCPWSSA